MNPAAMQFTTLRFPVGDGATLPLTLNYERKAGRWGTIAAIDWWKTRAAEAVREHRLRRFHLDRVEIEFAPVYAKGNLPDTGSIFPTEKAIVDGLVEMGVLPDDNHFHVAGQMSRPPVKGEQTMVLVTLVPVEPVDHDCGCRARWERQQYANQAKSRSARR